MPDLPDPVAPAPRRAPAPLAPLSGDPVTLAAVPAGRDPVERELVARL